MIQYELALRTTTLPGKEAFLVLITEPLYSVGAGAFAQVLLCGDCLGENAS